MWIFVNLSEKIQYPGCWLMRKSVFPLGRRLLCLEISLNISKLFFSFCKNSWIFCMDHPQLQNRPEAEWFYFLFEVYHLIWKNLDAKFDITVGYFWYFVLIEISFFAFVMNFKKNLLLCYSDHYLNPFWTQNF